MVDEKENQEKIVDSEKLAKITEQFNSSNRIEQMINVWKEQMKQGQTLFIKGGVGIGKTEMVKKCSQDLNRELIMFHLARNSNTDFIIPNLDNGVMKFAVNEKLLKLKEGNKILFIDEYDRADGMTRNAILSLLNERVFEDIKLPDSVAIVLAGNQETSRDTNTMNQAEWSRCSVYELNAKNLVKEDDYLKYWIKIAINKLQIDSRIVSFILENPEKLYQETEDNVQFATPRSWANLSKCMPIIDKLGKSDTVLKSQIISSYIGQGIGENFLTYLEIYSKLPSAKDILAGKLELSKDGEIEKKIAVSDILLNYLKNMGSDNSNKEALSKLEEVIKFISDKMGEELLYNFIMMGKEYKQVAELFLKGSKNPVLIDILAEIAFMHSLDR